MRIVIYALLLFFLECSAELRIVELKNYFIILDTNYKQCSPLEGMIWWEAGIVENIYRIADQDDATTKLVKLLFHLHADGTFDVSRAPQQSANSGAAGAHFSPEIIAELIDFLESHKTIEQIEHLRKTITNKKFVQCFLKKYNDTFPADGKYEKNLQKIFRHVCDSYIECSPHNQNARYIPFTTHRILLSYLWKKAHSQQDLLRFISSLLKNKPILRPEFMGMYQTLLHESYDVTSINNFFASIASKNSAELMTDENYEIAICSLFFHKPVGMISHASGVRYKGFEFPNCGEVAFLNFFNQILHKNGEYDISLIEKPGIIVHPKLKHFYQIYRTPADMKNKQVHNDWAEVVSEIPAVAYRTGGTQPVFNEIDKTSICNMAGIGCQQLDKVFNFLLGFNSFADVPQLSRPSFNINYSVQNPTADQFKTYIITINDEPAMQWECTDGHFALKFIKQSQHTRLLPSTIVQELLQYPLREHPRACSLLTITQDTELFQKTIAKEPISMPVFTFSYLLPNIKNADDARDFLQTIFNNYTKITENKAPHINALIKRIYLNLPTDLNYAGFLSSHIIENHIESLYEFILVDVPQKLNSWDKQFLFSYIFKRAFLANNKILLTRLLDMYKDQSEALIKIDLLSFIMFEGINSLPHEEKNKWHNFVVEEFKKLEKQHQARVCNTIIAKASNTWNSLLAEHLKSYNWKDYVPETYERTSPLNPHHVLPQTIFAHLLKTQNNSDVTQWLMNHFTFMIDDNKLLALKLFATLPEWNSWIKENFYLLKPNKNSYRSLQAPALKILIEQNSSTMKDFITAQVESLNYKTMLDIFNFIIKNNHQDFFDLVVTYFDKLPEIQQKEITTNIILYNHSYFKDFIEQYLEKSDEIARKNLLASIVSTKYRFKNGAISREQMSGYFFGDSEEGTSISNDGYYKWYYLVEKWLPQITNDYSALEVIRSIEENNITPLEQVAQQRKSLIKKDILD